MKDAILSFISDEKLRDVIPVKHVANFKESLKKKLREKNQPFDCFYDFEQWVVRESMRFNPKS